MLKAYRDLSPVKKNVEVEIPADDVARELGHVTAEFGRHAKIPGFRSGKIPTTLVRSRFAKEIQDEVVQRLLPRFFHEAVSEKGVAPVGSPLLKRVDAIIEGGPLSFEAEFEIKPEFELRDYRGLEVREGSAEVREEEVEKMIDRLRDQSSTFRPIEERSAEDGDFVVMDIVSSGEGLESRTSESAHIQLGEETPLPELHEALRGKRPGDSFKFDKSYGEDTVNEDIRGKTVHYDVAVKELRQREKPELTDDFAKSVGFDSLQVMTDRVREDIKRHKEAEVLKAKRVELAEKLVAVHEFDVPEVLVEEELGNALRNYARYLASQGVDLERAELDWGKVRDEFRPDAVKRAKRQLILESIARKEELSVSDAEVDAEIRRAASDSKGDVAEIKQRLRADGGYEELRLSLLQERALDLVITEAHPVRE